MDGDYLVEAIGVGPGTYGLEVWFRDSSGKPAGSTSVSNVQTEAGMIHQYVVRYSSTSVAQPVLATAAFDGGGQRPSDVNRFLRYGRPSQSKTTLTAGTTVYRVAITYGAGIDPNTFSARLNDVDVTDRFAPASGKSESVEVPLVTGTNILRLSVDGTTERGTIARDADRLVFIVP